MNMRKMMMVLALAFTTSLVHAQNNGSSYQTALGVKMYPGAISVKHFTHPWQTKRSNPLKIKIIIAGNFPVFFGVCVSA